MQSRTNKKNSMSAGYKFRIKSLSSPSLTHERFSIKKRKENTYTHNTTHFLPLHNFYKRTLRQEREFYGKRAGQMNRKTYISIRYKSLKIIIFNNYLYKRKERETGEEIIFKLT
jgi:hypothetical protein